MGLDNPLHIAFLLLILLLVFGAKRLPEMGRSLGSGLRGFKDTISGEVTASPELTAAEGSSTAPGSPVGAGSAVAAGSPMPAGAAPRSDQE